MKHANIIDFLTRIARARRELKQLIFTLARVGTQNDAR